MGVNVDLSLPLRSISQPPQSNGCIKNLSIIQESDNDFTKEIRPTWWNQAVSPGWQLRLSMAAHLLLWSRWNFQHGGWSIIGLTTGDLWSKHTTDGNSWICTQGPLNPRLLENNPRIPRLQTHHDWPLSKRQYLNKHHHFITISTSILL